MKKEVIIFANNSMQRLTVDTKSKKLTIFTLGDVKRGIIPTQRDIDRFIQTLTRSLKKRMGIVVCDQMLKIKQINL